MQKVGQVDAGILGYAFKPQRIQSVFVSINIISISMGNHICTQTTSTIQSVLPLSHRPSLICTQSHKLSYPSEDQLLQEFDNPSRGVNDLSFLKTQIEASNQRLTTLPPQTFSHQQIPNQKDVAQAIPRTYTPSQAPSIFNIESSEPSSGKKDWSELAFCGESGQGQLQPREESSEPVNRPRKATIQSILQEKQQNTLQQKQEIETASTILRQLSGYILSEKNMFEPIQISKDAFVKFREDNIECQYVFLQKIGEGSYGNVFKALHRKNKTFRAIKVLKKCGNSSLQHQKTMNEINILKRLDHPHVIKIYEVFYYNSNYYIVTEYCEGGSLSKFLKNHIVTPQQAQVIFRQLISALAYIHSQHIVHRDIKLDNILIVSKLESNGSTDIDIRLIDFGLSKQIKGKRIRDRQKIGTYTYMAPEVLEGLYSPKCDMWSAGIVLYYLLGHRHPFKAKTKEETFQRIISENINFTGERWKRIKKEAKSLLLGLLEKQHSYRISSEEALKNSWLRMAQDPQGAQAVNQAIKRLHDYHRGNNFVSMIQSYIAYTRTSQKEIQQFGHIFSLFDQNNDGYIEREQLQKAFQGSKDLFQASEIQYVLKKVDKQHGGKINYSQFVTMLSDHSRLFARQSLVEAFQYLDTDGNGYVQREELKKILRGGGFSELNCLLSELDENEDQRISLEQFIQYLKNEHPCK